ncbi:hypothetical protein ACQCT6_07995 [Cytobacillus gottheilii]|uniref:Uncharacterized protein n=1 Tax=Cytobacillus gottheilii TaxID=859144 RepID=A0ABX8F830_9BACI|nr:hypothetical protein [Cytobacillus gottheilii]QVY59903.1 hypothetical protein J1899_12655 [Cytobacillus gottheilii]
MNLVDWLFKTRNTLTEFIAVCIGFFFAILIPNLLDFSRVQTVLFIVMVFLLTRALEWIFAKAAGERDRSIPFFYYYGMIIFIPALVYLSVVFFK